ncbi:hypothetical protein VNI00_013318 [Paramarasmius palmivorus]|uniref:CBM1 domain-containing protein n=1 Tax=Paramarasmius palmivorus TaxID=297713 RepID=A0AAW0C1M6_9AGAR
MIKSSLFALIGLAVTVSADVPVWGQCGGSEWTGDTVCSIGTYCSAINEDYSQCIPGDTPGQPRPVPSADANFWFSFGDSYTQTGFEIDGATPTVGNPLGNPPYPGWTATGGENWVDYGTTTYNKSLVLTYNFAYGGATIDAELVPPYEPTVRSMTDQVNIFLNSTAEKPEWAPWTSENALFSVWIGINDLGNSFYLGGDRDAFSDTLLDAEFALVQQLVLNNSDTTSQELEQSVIEGFNSKLEAKIEAFRSENSDVITTYFYDSYSGFTKILDDPTSYGFKDATSYGDGEDIFWGNDYHPSSYAHKYFAEDVAEVLADTIW